MKKKIHMGNVIEHAKWHEKVCFGFAASSYACEMAVANAYLLLFCTDIMGVEAKAVGTLFLVGKLLDACTDIFVTDLADKTLTPWGKYRPWILMGIPMALGFFFLYFSPGFLETNLEKLIWLYVLYILTIPICETSITCPTMVMCTSISQYDRDRMHLVTAKSLGEASGDFICSFLIMPVVLMFGSYRNVTGWRVAAAMMAGLIILFSLIGFLGTKERIVHTSMNEEGRTYSFRQKLQALKGNTPFWKMIAITFASNVLWLFPVSLSSYFCIYNLGNENLVSVAYMTATAAQIAATCLTPILYRWFSKRTLLITGAAISVLSGLTCILVSSRESIIFYTLLRGCGNGLIMTVIWALWPDVTDYTEQNSRKAVPGIVMAFANFDTKISIGLASCLVTACLTMVGYNQQSEVQSAQTLAGIQNWLAWVPVIMGSIIILLAVFLKELQHGKMETIRSELYQKRLKKETAANQIKKIDCP